MPTWLLATALLACCAQIAGFHDLRHDDAFITFRYGQNLALGFGLVFNPGEHVMGSTSPGDALLSASIYRAVGLEYTPSVMAAIGCIAWSAQALALWWLLAPAIGALGASCIAACVLAGAAQSWAWVALETNLAVAFTLFALVAADRARFALAAALCGLAALVRPDTLVLTSLVALRAGLESRGAIARALLRPALVFAAIAVPWLLFALGSFGTVVPRSLRAKLQRSPLGEYAAHMLEHWTATLTASTAPWVTLACIALALVGGIALVRKRRALRYFVAYGALHFAAYSVLRSVAGHDWHLYPGVLIAAVLALCGVFELTLRAAQRFGTRARRGAVAIVGVPLAIFYAARTTQGALRHGTDHWNGARDAVYRELAGYMKPRAVPGERFAAVEVGTLGYYTQLPVFDVGMLVSDREERPAGHIRWVVLDEAFLALAPDLPPVADARVATFHGYLYDLPQNLSYFDVVHEKLATALDVPAGR